MIAASAAVAVKALAELVVQIPRDRASLVLLHLEEPCHQRLARGSRGGEVLRKVVDRLGNVIELSGAEPR